MGKVLVQVEITPHMLMKVSDVARLLGQFEGHRCGLKPQVKRDHLLRNLHGNLALEGSTLTVAEVNAVTQGEKVGAMTVERVQANAFSMAYEKSLQFDVANIKDLLTAFLLMNEGHQLYSQEQETAVEQWNSQMKDALERMGILFRYIRGDRMEHPLIKAAVFHYQMFHIRPFTRCSDAVARLWHRLLWAEYHPLFMHAPFESLLKRNQQEYLNTLGTTNCHEGLQRFIEFNLTMATDSLSIMLDGLDARSQRVDERLAFARMHFGSGMVTRKKYMQLFGNIGPATASRDLKSGMDIGLLSKKGEKARTEYFFV